MSDNFWDILMGDDEHASSYMATYNEGPGYVTRHTVASYINDGESVLDVGCGPGWNLDHFQEHGPRIGAYLGLDYSARFVRVANKRWENKFVETANGHLYKGPNFALGDARDIKEPDESWDVVIMQDCLEHTNGYEKPIQEALRVAKKRAIVSFWHLDGNESTEHINNDGNDGWGAWYDKTKWEAFLDTLGYSWIHQQISPEGKTHPWDFYVINKEVSDE